MRCREFTEKLEEVWPLSFAESWDNPGLLTGRADKEIKTVMLALDATDEVVEEAVAKGADLLLTHHPLIFSARKQINDSDFIGRRLVRLLGNDICCYAMHTNFDVLTMADVAAEKIGLSGCRVLDVTWQEGEREAGIGRVGKLPEPAGLDELGVRLKELFGLEQVAIFGEQGREISLVAVCPGSGKSVMEKAAQAGADVLITGDIGHHEGLDAMAMGIGVIDAGHFGLEQIFLPYMEEYLRGRWDGLTILRAQEKNPFHIV